MMFVSYVKLHVYPSHKKKKKKKKKKKTLLEINVCSSILYKILNAILIIYDHKTHQSPTKWHKMISWITYQTCSVGTIVGMGTRPWVWVRVRNHEYGYWYETIMGMGTGPACDKVMGTVRVWVRDDGYESDSDSFELRSTQPSLCQRLGSDVGHWQIQQARSASIERRRLESPPEAKCEREHFAVGARGSAKRSPFHWEGAHTQIKC